MREAGKADRLVAARRANKRVTRGTLLRLAVLVAFVGTAHDGRVEAQGVSPPAAAPLTFQAALELAAARNLGLEAARRQKAIREAQVRIARQYQNPDVAFDASRDAPHEAVTFSLPLEIGGKRARRIEVAKTEAGQADLDVRVEMRTLRRNLRQAFYGLLAADERARLERDNVSLLERVRQVTLTLYEEGAAPRLDARAADLGLARAKADSDLAASTRAAAQADLNAVLNQPAGQALAATGDLSEAGELPDLAAATALALASNTDLLAAQQDAAVEERRLSLVKAERVPTPIFSVGGVFDAPGEFRAGVSGGVSVAVPLFNRGGGEIAQVRATLFQLAARRDAVRRSVENAVFGAVARIAAQRRQIEAYRTTIVPAATELAALAEESYKLGRSAVLAYFDAQRALRDVRREYLQALVDFQSAVADLEEVIGAAIH
jgi:cobalt-zinc-cadmium efflux system outer membrane protein